MKKIAARMFALFLIMLPLLAVSSHAAEKKKEAVVLMPMRATKDIPQDEMTQYEAALVKSLSEKYVVHSGQKVLEKVNDVYKKRSSEATAGKECDETRCLQDVALAFQTKEGYPFVAIANIRKTGGGYSISLTINDVIEETSVFANSIPCKGCDEFKIIEVLQTLAGSGAAPQPVAEAPAAAQPPPLPSSETAAAAFKGAGSNDMELSFWNSIKDSTNPADFAAYLESYPKGSFAPLAKRRMEKTPAQVAAEKAAAEKAAAEKAAAEKAAAEKAAAEEEAAEKKAVEDKAASAPAAERIFWRNIKNSIDPNDFAAYLQKYPDGTFAPLAKRQMAKSPAQFAAERAAAEKAEKAAAEKAAAEEEAKHPGMVYVKKGDSGFYMDKTEVTQEAYQRVIGSNPSKFTGCPTCPVEQVNWDEATAYCNKVGKRLPTEQDWEYAATSGGKGETYAGTRGLRHKSGFRRTAISRIH